MKNTHVHVGEYKDMHDQHSLLNEKKQIRLGCDNESDQPQILSIWPFPHTIKLYHKILFH